jgi:hypothetical protein
VGVVFAVLVVVISSSGCIEDITTLNMTEDTKASGDTLKTLNLKGVTDPGANVTVDGKRIEVEGDGKFNYTVKDISMGNTTITIIAKSENKTESTALVKIKRSKEGNMYSLEYLTEYPSQY